MHLGKAALADEGQGLAEFLLRLLREAGDQVRGNGGAVKPAVQQLHGFQIPGGIVLPVHPLQRGVAPALHGQVELGAQVGQGRRPAAEVLRHRPGLQAPQPQPDLRRGGAQRLQQVDEGLAVFQVVAPGGNFNAGENDLPVSLRRQLPRLLHRLFQGQGPHRPPCVGNDAVGAEIHAAVLDFQHGPGAALHASGGQHLKGAALKGLVDGLQVLLSGGGLLQQGDEALPVAGAGDQVHPQLPDVLGVGLGIAAAHRHHRRRMLLLHPVDHLAGLLVADGGDGAGVHHVGVGLPGKIHHLMALGPEGLLHGLGLVLIHLAAQGVNGDFHRFSLRFSNVSSIINNYAVRVEL